MWEKRVDRSPSCLCFSDLQRAGSCTWAVNFSGYVCRCTSGT